MRLAGLTISEQTKKASVGRHEAHEDSHIVSPCAFFYVGRCRWDVGVGVGSTAIKQWGIYGAWRQIPHTQTAVSFAAVYVQCVYCPTAAVQEQVPLRCAS